MLILQKKTKEPLTICSFLMLNFGNATYFEQDEQIQEVCDLELYISEIIYRVKSLTKTKNHHIFYPKLFPSYGTNE